MAKINVTLMANDAMTLFSTAMMGVPSCGGRKIFSPIKIDMKQICRQDVSDESLRSAAERLKFVVGGYIDEAIARVDSHKEIGVAIKWWFDEKGELPLAASEPAYVFAKCVFAGMHGMQDPERSLELLWGWMGEAGDVSVTLQTIACLKNAAAAADWQKVLSASRRRFCSVTAELN